MKAIFAAAWQDHETAAAKERQERKPVDSVPVNLPEQKGDARDKAGEAVGVTLGKLRQAV